MKRVLFVDHVNRILGGGEINLLELLAHPRAGAEWTMACACPRESKLGQAVSGLNVPVYDYGFAASLNELRVVDKSPAPLRAIKGYFALSAAQKRLASIIKEFRPDVVISCTNKDDLCAAVVCRQLDVPNVWWVNDILSPDFFPWGARTVFIWHARRGPQRLVTVSEHARRALLDAGLNDDLVTTIHNGIPLERYARDRKRLIRDAFQLTDDEPLVGIVGRYTPWKGQDFFLRVAEAWTQTNPRGHFVLIGHAFNEEQAYEAQLREFVAQKGLSQRVHFLPFQSEIATALSDLDALIHASVRPEPFGRVIIEAMAVGVPVIGARAGGVPEIITHSVDGLLATPGSEAEYLAALRILLTDTAKAQALSEAARQTVQQRFTLERVWQQFDAVLTEAGA